MQFTTLLIASAAFAGSVLAQPLLTAVVYSTVTLNKEFIIPWSNATGPVTLVLKNGPPGALQTVETIATGLDSVDGKGSFAWTPTDLAKDTYAIEIIDGTVPNYSTQFQLIGATAEPSLGTAASNTASATSVVSSDASSTTDSTATTTDSSAQTTATDSSSTDSSNTATRTTGSSNTRTATGATTSSTTAAPGSANGLASPLAMVLLGFAAFLSFQ